MQSARNYEQSISPATRFVAEWRFVPSLTWLRYRSLRILHLYFLFSWKIASERAQRSERLCQFRQRRHACFDESWVQFRRVPCQGR